jgi:hypothetical protein
MPGIYLNIDCNGYWYNTNEANVKEKMDVAAMRRYVRQYAGTQVKALLFNLNGQKVTYASKRVPRIWDGFDPEAGLDQPIIRASNPQLKFPEEAEKARGMYFFLKLYYDMEKAGIDPFSVWFDECRNCGIEGWISYRMNDRHNVDNPEHPMHADIWKKDHSIWRYGYRFENWDDRAMDYGREEVRDYYFAMIEESLERYDVDGVEVDWMRSGYHFKPGREDAGIKVLNDYMLRVRRLLDTWELKRGHRVQLSARVPSSPVTARYLGYDPVEWARQGWVDRIVATNHWATTDSYPPVEIWKQLLAGTKTKLDIGNEILVRPDKWFPVYPYQTPETIRGYALSALARGADGVYLFNFMDTLRDGTFDPMSKFIGELYDRTLRELGDCGVLRGKSRRHVVTCADVWAEGEAAACALPRRLDRERYTNFRISVGEAPAEGQKAWVVAAFAGPDAIDSVNLELTEGDKSTWGSMYERKPEPAPATAAEVEVRVNGVVCPPDSGVTAATEKLRHPLCWRIPDTTISGSAAVVEFHGTGATLIWLEIYIG